VCPGVLRGARPEARGHAGYGCPAAPPGTPEFVE
jgi:hypothetical protein